MRIYVDDERPAPHSLWTLVRTYQKALDLLIYRPEEIKEISLDYCLSDNENETGEALAQFIQSKLIEKDRRYVNIVVFAHSGDKHCRARIEKVIRKIDKLQDRLMDTMDEE